MTPETRVIEALRYRPWLDRQELRQATRLPEDDLTGALVRLTDAERIRCMVSMKGRGRYDGHSVLWDTAA